MLLTVFIFILGLIVGSFLNVVVYRLKQKKTFLRGRSFCPSCKRKLTLKDLVPLFSFIFQKKKCRYCKKKISWQYPLVEAAVGLLFVLVWWHHMGLELNAWCSYGGLDLVCVLRDFIIASFLIIIFVYDLKYYLILDKVSIPLIIIALIFNLVLGMSFYNLLIGGLVGGGFFLVQYLISRGRWIGGGDIRLGIAMGIILGWPGVLLALFLAYLIGSVGAVILLALKKKKWGSEIPLGTFLTVATFIWLLYGDIIWQAYSSWAFRW